jgi:hypothetical protein
MALDPERSLDTFFDSAQAVRTLSEAWPNLVGSVMLVVGADEASEDGSWGAVTDMQSITAVQSIAETFRATQRNVPLPTRELEIFLGDQDGVQPRVVASFGGCPAEVLGEEGVEARLLETASELSAEEGIDQVLAVGIDPLGRPTTLIFTGDAPERAIQSVVASALIASARFRPAYVEGVPIQSRVHLADADVYPEDIRQVYIGGLDRPLRGVMRDRRGNPITTASRSGVNGGVPCGRGGSQYAVMCGYDYATGRVTNSSVNRNLAHVEQLERSTERGKISYRIDQRLGRNR